MNTAGFEVRSGDVTIAGDHRGDPARPAVVLVHGFPDDASLWDDVVDRLADDLHVIRYDVRGAGRSTAPDSMRGYAFDRLVADLLAVVDHLRPDERVHVVGHDWGAIQLWEAAAIPRVADRIATFTAISAPSLDLAGRWTRARLRSPSAGGARDLLGQARRSWYLSAFRLPWLPERFVDSDRSRRLAARLPALEGLQFSEHASRNARNGLDLYRANLHRIRAPQRDRVHVPVQVVVGAHDPAVSSAVFDDLDHHAPRVHRRVVADGRHWLPRTHPDVVVDAVITMVATVEPP